MNSKGFTLIELLAVIAIVSLLSGTVLFAFRLMNRRAEVKGTLQEVKGVVALVMKRLRDGMCAQSVILTIEFAPTGQASGDITPNSLRAPLCNVSYIAPENVQLKGELRINGMVSVPRENLAKIAFGLKNKGRGELSLEQMRACRFSSSGNPLSCSEVNQNNWELVIQSESGGITSEEWVLNKDNLFHVHF